jgi:hypothetical protein
MAVEIVPYAPRHVPLVRAFNQRLAAANSTWAFYEEHRPDWLAPEPDQPRTVWREYFVAVENDQVARGGYCLKPQQFELNGRNVLIANWQGPVSEGEVDRRYALLALQMMRDMERRQPLLFAWGASERLSELLRRLGWRSAAMPFLLRVVRPVVFLRHNAFLRTSRQQRLALDLAAFTGLGSAGIRLLQRAMLKGGHATAEAVVERSFGEWTDAIWQQSRHHYSMVALRDQQTQNALMSSERWPERTILRMVVQDRTIGWAAVRDTQMTNDRRFGDLRVGSIIDAFGTPDAARSIIRAASRFLEQRGVHMIAANLSHPDWITAARGSGFLMVPNRRLFAVSPSFSRAYPDFDKVIAGMHLTLIDGDGPRGL